MRKNLDLFLTKHIIFSRSFFSEIVSIEDMDLSEKIKIRN